MTPCDYLRSLANEVAEAYISHTHPHAVLLTASVATGEIDAYSDCVLSS